MAVNYIWKDRKRYLGMPLSFTRYRMSEDRLFLSVGFFRIRDEEVLLYRVRDITTTRTLWQRIFGVGTVTVVSSDKSTPTLALKNIQDPLRVKELLHKQVEVMKLRRRVRIGEVMSNDFPNDDDDDNSDDDLDLPDED
ncbi:MAG TPA: PH domain-containing protein [Candidatus Faecousia intestinigallinarum]|nr:PH domain-containing protein [Candidatus Faecousia intestinigallinarum]